MSELKDQDNLLEEWHEKFVSKRLNHMKIAKQYNIASWVFGILNVILSAAGSVFSTINATDRLMGISSNIVNALIHFMVFLFTGIQHFAHFQSKELVHLNCSHQYSELTRLLEYQQTLPKTERDINEILKKYDDINSKEPLISGCC